MAEVSMTIIPAWDPTADLSLVGAFSDAPTRVIGKLTAESDPLLVGYSVGEKLAAQFEECAVSGYSLRQTCGEDTNCPSGKPTGPFLCTHAFCAIRGGLRSVAQVLMQVSLVPISRSMVLAIQQFILPWGVTNLQVGVIGPVGYLQQEG